MRMLEQIIADVDKALAKGQEKVLVAIDGNCASGKTTLAKALGEHYSCNVFHMDNFFLRPEQRTAERLHQPGGNVDYERFKSEVLEPLNRGESFAYRIYDCKEGRLTSRVEVQPSRVNIVEGAYSQHPYFGDAYQLRYWMFVNTDEQRRRILVRNGAGRLSEFTEKWIPLEEAYFDASGNEEWKAMMTDEAKR